jgi:adenylate kinase
VYQRADDTAETVGNRIDVYNEQTMPLVGYYEAMGLLREYDGMSGADAVFAEIEKLLDA